MAKGRKEKEMEALNAVANMPPFEDLPHTARSSRSSEPPNIDWASMEMPIEWSWDVFLNPDLIMSTYQDQSAVNATLGGQL